jgi:uncharacterized protein (DUF697 family)/predicted GTPase
MLDKLKHWFHPRAQQEALHERLEKLRQRSPIPFIWLFGKTQSGKTSIIKYLTGADDAEIGEGFRPCTRFSREFQFPTPEAPLLTFLDTRGLDEPGYDVAEDLARFNDQAHVVLVTVKALDHAQENVLKHLRKIREAQPARPIVLALTCLHEAYPQQQHPEVYPFHSQERPAPGGNGAAPSAEASPWKVDAAVPEPLRRTLEEQYRRFQDLIDRAVPIDLTRPEEGFAEPNYGGDRLKHVLLELLPTAYRQTLIALDEANKSLQDLYTQRTLPHIIGYSTLAATAGAVPVPWIDLLVLPGIQTQMIFHLARLYGQELSGARFLELASTLGIGMVVRQAVREVVKFVPFVGSVASGALAGASTFALGKAFCYYYRSVHQGHVPPAAELKRYYQEQLALAEKAWRTTRGQAKP